MNPTRRPFVLARTALLCLGLTALTGCDQLGLETPAKTAQLREEEGKAIGGACRHAGRALEDCYQLNPKHPKASVYTGWRDMDAYMRENKLDTIAPEFEPKNAPPRISKGEEKADAAEPAKDSHGEEAPAEAPAKGKAGKQA